MTPKKDEPLIPCEKCGKHHSAADTACPHCGTALSQEGKDNSSRRYFLLAALAAGGAAVAWLGMYWNRMRGAFGPSPRMIAEYGVPVRPPGGPGGGGFTKVPEWRPAYDAHDAGSYEDAAARYEKLLEENPQRPDAQMLRNWLDDAKARRPPRK